VNRGVGLYFLKLKSFVYIFFPGCIFPRFCGGLRACEDTCMKMKQAVQGHPKSLILVGIESIYSTS